MVREESGAILCVVAFYILKTPCNKTCAESKIENGVSCMFSLQVGYEIARRLHDNEKTCSMFVASFFLYKSSSVLSRMLFLAALTTQSRSQ